MGIRHRLLTILLLGVIVSGLTLAALIQLLSTTTRQRVERARDSVAEEVGRLAVDFRTVSAPSTSTVVGMRAGREPSATPSARLPADWVSPLGHVLERSRSVSGAVTEDVSVGDGELVVSAAPAAGGGFVWAGYLVRPLPSVTRWQWIVTLLALATGVLVATTLYAIVTVQRGATALRRALSELATDLSAPIPRLEVRELASVAEGVRGLADGLAEARRKEESLQGELARKERLAALGRVVAGVAHEVRNPLASIKLRLDLARAGARLPEEVEKAIAHATTEIGRLDRLVADLLIVAGRAAGKRQLTSIGALVRSRVELLGPWASARGVSLATGGEAFAEIDVDAISRAVDNLLRNAVEASPAGEGVRVQVELGEAGGEDGKRALTIVVSDRGTGVPPRHVAELFEPFFTTKSDGTGLGLALSRAIARAHGGALSYTREDAVTRFSLSIEGACVASEANEAGAPDASRPPEARP